MRTGRIDHVGRTQVGRALCGLLLLGNALAAGLVPVTAHDTATPVADPATFPSYEMDLRLDPDKRTLGGTLAVAWTNTTGSPQEEIYVRLYPNADYYGDAETLVEDVRIDDAPVEFASPDDRTVLQVTPAEAVAPEDAITITLAFTTIVPVDTAGSFGIFQLSSESGVWNLADWYPVLAGYEPGTGWYLQSPTDFGDPTFGETSSYNVTIEVPEALTLISTGATVATQLGFAGTRKEVIETGPARDFAITLLPDDVDQVETAADDVAVHVTLPGDATAPGLADFMAQTASAALTTYEGWLGEYPYDDFDLSVAPLSGATGVSWSGMTWFSLASITADGELTDEEKTGLTFVILHEVGHQWIADIVGSNNNDHGFMTEGLTNVIAVLAADEIFGPRQADQYLRAWVAGPYTSLLNDGRDGIADAPITDDSNGVLRSLLIYGKAAVGFIAIREEIGADAFRKGLADYATNFRFGISEPDDLRAALAAAGDTDLDDLWSFWFNEDTTTLDDVTAVLNAFTDQEEVAPGIHKMAVCT